MNNLRIRGYTATGERVSGVMRFEPTLFLSSSEETEWKTPTGNFVMPFKFKSMSEAGAHAKDNHKNTFGQNRWHSQYIDDVWPGEVPYKMEFIKIGTIDIETECEDGFPHPETAAERILLITCSNGTRVDTFGLKPWTQDETRNKLGCTVNYHLCADEEDLLCRFMTYWVEQDFDIITGWNVEGFDILYLYNRMVAKLGEEYAANLSPWKEIELKEVYVNKKEVKRVLISGIAILDYLNLYKKFSYEEKPSYTLDAIAEAELKVKKIAHQEFDSFKDFYTNDWNKFVDYNVVDTILVDRLEKAKKYLRLALTITYYSHALYDDVFATTRLWDSIACNVMKKNGIILKLSGGNSTAKKYEGAYVRDPHIGRFDWIMNFDVNSMHPHIMHQWGKSPENMDFISDEEEQQILAEAMPDYPPERRMDLARKFYRETTGIQDEAGLSALCTETTCWKEAIMHAIINGNVKTDVLIKHGVCLSASGKLFKSKTGLIGKMVMDIYAERVACNAELDKKTGELMDVEAEIERRKKNAISH